MAEISKVRRDLLAQPQIRLYGSVDEKMYCSFREQMGNAPDSGLFAVAITTLGGDPEMARLMADDIRLLRQEQGREILFLGKIAVYSAGATFMAGFAVENRYLTRTTRLMIHERKLDKEVRLEGPLRTLKSTVKALMNEIEYSIAIEEEGFREIIDGSSVEFEELRKRAPSNWYIPADEALEFGLVAGVI